MGHFYSQYLDDALVIWYEPIRYETRAPIANPPNIAQLEGTPYHSPKLHPGQCSCVGIRRATDRQTGRHTDGRGQYTFRLGYASREMLLVTLIDNGTETVQVIKLRRTLICSP